MSGRDRRSRVRSAWWCAGALLLAASATSGAPTSGTEGLRLAYVDPGTGSFVIQAIVALVGGGAAAAGLYWKKLKARLGGGVDDEYDEDDDSIEPEEKDA